MTQHALPSQTQEDQRTMRALAAVIGVFIVATAVLAVTVGAIMG